MSSPHVLCSIIAMRPSLSTANPSILPAAMKVREPGIGKLNSISGCIVLIASLPPV